MEIVALDRKESEKYCKNQRKIPLEQFRIFFRMADRGVLYLMSPMNRVI
jgi:hypothetical protein